jgi:NADH oxidase (H2O2-forming)
MASMSNHYCGTRVVVIGNGPAGNWAAMKARALNPACHVILVSEEKEAEYSPCALPHYISGQLNREKLFLKSLDDYRRDGIDFRPGLHVEGVDSASQRVYAWRAMFEYDRLVLATGADAVVPSIDGVETPGCFSAKTLRDGDAIISWRPRVVVVVGCGPIGLEVASLLFDAGCRVHLYEVLPRVAQAVLDEPISQMVAERIRQGGIDLHLSEKVKRVLGRKGRVTGVEAESGIVACDTVIWATGVRPRVQLAEIAGLSMGSHGGIRVDNGMRTSRPEILACGDCVESVDCITGQEGPIMLWGSAVQQGVVAGANAVGRGLAHRGSLRLISMSILGVKICSAGLTKETASHLPGLTLHRIAWKRAAYSLLMSEDRVVGIQALGKEIDPAPFQAFLSKGLNVSGPCESSNHPTSQRKAPWLTLYESVRTFEEGCLTESQ